MTTTCVAARFTMARFEHDQAHPPRVIHPARVILIDTTSHAATEPPSPMSKRHGGQSLTRSG
ncbi:hypothetical protein [Phytoactinopolyspora endophytica]|uniref:hypothetical protein n=1 Tax=Phytoactinopolyspora endophytica TaxID=1642495 RepID=UPI00101D7139|nr:hypothetical protein [Phytoactinopolyspora endophytica]